MFPIRSRVQVIKHLPIMVFFLFLFIFFLNRDVPLAWEPDMKKQMQLNKEQRIIKEEGKLKEGKLSHYRVIYKSLLYNRVDQISFYKTQFCNKFLVNLNSKVLADTHKLPQKMLKAPMHCFKNFKKFTSVRSNHWNFVNIYN